MKKKIIEHEIEKNESNHKDKKVTVVHLIIAWFCVFIAIACAAFVPINPKLGNYLQLALVSTSFASFVATSLFSFLLYSHNSKAREAANEMRRASNEINERNEEFRTLQFIASNYAMVEFVDHMLMHEAREQYVKRLRAEKDYTFYLRETDISIDDLEENFCDYRFLTIRIPISVIVGQTISKIKIVRFKFVKGEKEYRFHPVTDGQKCLIIYNETAKRSEAVINIITKKESEFFTPGTVEPFSKIKVSLAIQSLLGVVLQGWTELYFTNPKKLETDGANRYQINSSHFEITGLPVLLHSVNQDMKQNITDIVNK